MYEQGSVFFKSNLKLNNSTRLKINLYLFRFCYVWWKKNKRKKLCWFEKTAMSWDVIFPYCFLVFWIWQYSFGFKLVRHHLQVIFMRLIFANFAEAHVVHLPSEKHRKRGTNVRFSFFLDRFDQIKFFSSKKIVSTQFIDYFSDFFHQFSSLKLIEDA